MLEESDLSIIFAYINRANYFSSTIFHWGPARRARPVKVGSHHLLNNLNAEKVPAQW